jgi:RNA polymerase sigma-70 factor, ECF subfamily
MGAAARMDKDSFCQPIRGMRLPAPRRGATLAATRSSKALSSLLRTRNRILGTARCNCLPGFASTVDVFPHRRPGDHPRHSLPRLNGPLPIQGVIAPGNSRHTEVLRDRPRGPAVNPFGRILTTMTLAPPVHAAMVSTIPKLRAFAISLCRSREHADDLVQETLLRACANIASFQPGTNMAGWLFAILRNCFYTERRKRRREVEDSNGAYAETLVIQPDQIARAEYGELHAALAALPDEMREAVILVGAFGMSCDEAARICGCAVGTIKSRVHRARVRLAALLSLDGSADLEDPIPQSVLIRAEYERSRIH